MSIIPSESFDLNDENNIGRPIFWRLDTHIKSIEQMIRADELQYALEMCDHIPGWYRDNYPTELLELKKKLYKHIYDQIQYATDDEEAGCDIDFGKRQWTNGYMHPRAEITRDLVKGMNDKNDIPWIFDLGCSHGNLPLGLMQEGLNFEYLGKGMNWRIVEKVKEWVKPFWLDSPREWQKTILYCTEVLEHAFNPHDLIHSAYKVGVDFDYIILSTPLYTLGGGLPEIERPLGHVRTWTPREFQKFASDAFIGYKWKMYLAPSMVLVGEKCKP